MAKPKFLVLRGVLNYPKIVGGARKHTGLPKYDKGPFWSLELSPDAESLAKLADAGIDIKPAEKGKKLKIPKASDTNRHGNDPFLTLKVLENKLEGGKPTGEKNDPPKIIDAKGQAWSGKLIGNGSVADVKVKVVQYDGSEEGIYLQAVRILDLVPYESNDFDALPEDDEYFAAAEAQSEPNRESEAPANDDDLDDDVPF